MKVALQCAHDLKVEVMKLETQDGASMGEYSRDICRHEGSTTSILQGTLPL